MEREVPARGLDRGRRVADSSGASATTSRRSITSRSGRPTRRPRRTRSCRRGSASGRRICTASTPAVPGRTTRIRSSARAQLNGLLDAAGDARQLRPEGRAERALHAQGAGRRGDAWYVARDLGQTFGRTGVDRRRRAATSRSSRRPPFIKGVENGDVRFDYRGRHKALFDEHHAGRRALGLPAAAAR